MLTFAVLGAASASLAQGSDFFAISTLSDQATAAAACQAEGGSIASFHDAAEFAEASALCQSACEAYDSSNSGCGCWTGIRDDGTENIWYNEDGSDLEYVMDEDGNPYTGVSPWYSGEPNDWGTGEDCVHIWKAQNYLLNDIACSGSYLAVCRVNKVAEYFKIAKKYTQSEAAEACERRGGVIASFHRDYEFNAASALCERVCDNQDPDDAYCGCWTGLRDDGTENIWYNQDGSAQDYLMDSSGAPYTGVFPWYSGEPNDWASAEDCAHIWKAQDYQINDVSCDNEYYVICLDVAEPTPDEYFVIETLQTQAAGSAACVADNAKIASFHSDQDYASAMALCEAACDSNGITDNCGCWTGLRDDGTENIWYNEDGSNRDYLMTGAGVPNTGVYPWYSGEPNDWGTGEDCVHIWQNQGYYLNDIACSSSYYTMCERNPGDMISSNTFVAALLAEFEQEMMTNQYWMMLFTAAAAVLCFSCLVLTYCNFCRGQRRTKYAKVVMDSEFAESDCERQELNN